VFATRAVAAYAGTATIAGLLYHWFAPPTADCSLNISLITLALLLVLCLSLATFHPAVRQGNPAASIFPAAVTSLYLMYLCYSALASEPHAYECNSLGQRLNAASGTTLAAGMALTLVSIVYAAVRAGSNTAMFGGSWQEAGDVEESLLRDEELTSAGLDGVTPPPNMSESACMIRVVLPSYLVLIK
jgi:serine incorporator 1/3